MIERGEIWWADVGQLAASAPGYRRPVVVVSSDSFNASRINTVVVAMVTSNDRLAEAPGNVRLPAGQSGLDRDSVVNVSQIATLDKRHLTEKVGRLPDLIGDEIDDGLLLALDLGG